MPLIIFSDRMVCGVESIDQQHMGLLKIINQLYDSVLSHQKHWNLEKVLDEAMQYLDEHFRHEEQLFEEQQYPRRAEHHQRHEELRARLVAWRKMINTTADGLVAAEMLHSLRDWLEHHVLHDDKDACEFLNSHGVR